MARTTPLLLTTPRPLATLLLAVLAFMLGSALPAGAAAITFDSPITQPAGAPAVVNLGFALDYETPDIPLVPPEAFYTQGFAFGGRTEGVTLLSPRNPAWASSTIHRRVCRLARPARTTERTLSRSMSLRA